MEVNVIGAGLAGCEAAWYLANNGIKVNLYEQRPVNETEAHKTDKFAELVCSNSFRGNELTQAVGLLKEEMRMLDSIIIRSADETKVPAGGALAVDRDLFSDLVTKEITNHPNIEVVYDKDGKPRCYRDKKSNLKTGIYYLRNKAASDAVKFTVQEEQKKSVDEQMAEISCSLDNPDDCLACGA